MSTSNQSQLDDIQRKILDSNVCSGLAQQATQLVFGEGNPNADLVFIGEAPGKKEDQTGKPFVGAAGRFLNDMLSSIGLKREDVYITNIVKYRPPNNRDPSPEEKQAFLPYLVRQLEVIQPVVVVTLGRHSMEAFLPEQKISQIHGEPKRITFLGQKIVILPLFHPAAALYNGAMRQPLIDDFARIPVVLKKLEKQSLTK